MLMYHGICLMNWPLTFGINNIFDTMPDQDTIGEDLAVDVLTDLIQLWISKEASLLMMNSKSASNS